MSNTTLTNYVLTDWGNTALRNIPYRVVDNFNRKLAEGVTNRRGETSKFQGNVGTTVRLFLKLKGLEYTEVNQSFLGAYPEPLEIQFQGWLLDVALEKHEGEKGKYRRKTHKVEPKETVTSIAKKYGTTIKAIVNLNKLKDKDTIYAGQILKIPIKTGNGSNSSNDSASSSYSKKQKLTGTYIVKEGDTLWGIAQRAGVTEKELQKVNNISNPHHILPGQKVVIPNKNSSSTRLNTPKKNSAFKAPPSKSATQSIKLKQHKERSQETEAPKTIIGSVCEDSPACIQKGDKSKLILEVNIRLAGFGGALPSDEFTDLTEKCIKQFQRDYMGAPETGKICGSLLTAIDEFNQKYPVAKYVNQMKCPCGKCSGFGNGRMGVSSGKNIANEYPGIHRSAVWVMKASMFYLSDTNVGYTFRKVNSGYRCIIDNKNKGRTSVNHMGMALDFHFNYASNGLRAKQKSDIEKIRKIVFVEAMGAQYAWNNKNKISLELSKHGATTWVHVDVREFDSKYKEMKYFAKNISDMIGGDIISFAKDAKLIACAGKFAKPNAAQSYCLECNKDAIIVVNTNVGNVRVSDKLMKAIMVWEGSPKKPYVPGGKTASGITIGYGYDLGHQKADNARKDLAKFFSGKDLESLVSVTGKTGDSARAVLNKVKGISITKDVARKMFRNHITKYAKQTVSIYPEIIKLHPDCQGALVSLVYNRGTRLKDRAGSPSRKEMRNIRSHFKNNKPELIPFEIKSMKRIWRGKGQRGLLTRRDGEADFFRKGLEKHNAH